MKMRSLYRGLKTSYRGLNVSRRAQHFENWTARASSDGATTDYDHADTVREYYDLCSEFMVFGWGESLHFAPLSRHERLEESIARHQRLIISKLELRPGMVVIDVGCGVGGPMRRVVREADVRAVGVNSSEIQLDKAKALSAGAGLDHMVDYVHCSFMDMSAIEDNSFDRGYAIESTCHAPDKAGAFTEIYRVLKPGALFWGQEMCMTSKCDPDNDRHRSIKQDLMRGIALKDIETMDGVDRALESAGFRIVEGVDLAVAEDGPATPWYRPMEVWGGTRASALRRTSAGRKAAIRASRLAELLGVFPKGSSKVVELVDRTAGAYVAGGATSIFTPLYCFLARKPLTCPQRLVHP